MSLTKYREYEVDQEHLESKSLSPAIPALWLREHTPAGSKFGLFIESKTRAIIIGTPNQIAAIEKLLSESNGNGAAGGEGQ